MSSSSERFPEQCKSLKIMFAIVIQVFLSTVSEEQVSGSWTSPVVKVPYILLLFCYWYSVERYQMYDSCTSFYKCQTRQIPGAHHMRVCKGFHTQTSAKRSVSLWTCKCNVNLSINPHQVSCHCVGKMAKSAYLFYHLWGHLYLVCISGDLPLNWPVIDNPHPLR